MTNTVNNFTGAVFIVTDEHNPLDIAEQVAESYFPDTEYHFTLTDATPANLPDSIQQQMTAHQEALVVPSRILTIYPWAATENNLPARKLNG